MSSIIKAEAIAEGRPSRESVFGIKPEAAGRAVSPAAGVIDAAVIVSSAKRRATEIINRARAAAERLIADEYERLHRLRAQSVEEGYREGYRRGYEEGKKEAAQQAEQVLERHLASLTRAAQELAELRTEAVNAAERDMVKLSVLIAEKIVRGELANPERTLQIARSLLSEVRDESHVTVFLPEELDITTEEAGAVLRNEFASGLKLRIEKDPSLAIGDVRIETRWGWMDGRASVRWARLIDALRKGIDEYDDVT